MTQNGVCCIDDDCRVYLDPKSAIHRSGNGVDGQNNVAFVSHAHNDHLHRPNGEIILTSRQTSEIAKLRGYKIQNYTESMENFSLFNSGHIFGSKSLLFNDVFYTGDICTRNRGFLRGAEIPKCRVLITECTFGLPDYVFPPIRELVKRVNQLISDSYARGQPVILLGYEVGKSQTLAYLFRHWDPLYYHDSVKKVNDLHIQMGVELKQGLGHTEAEQAGLLDKKPWLMIAPSMSENNPFIKNMKAKYDAITIGFTGWSLSSKAPFFARRHDFTIPLSDHCGYDELIELVQKTGAEKIYTVHGFVDEFSASLRNMGFDAQPIREETMDDFL